MLHHGERRYPAEMIGQENCAAPRAGRNLIRETLSDLDTSRVEKNRILGLNWRIPGVRLVPVLSSLTKLVYPAVAIIFPCITDKNVVAAPGNVRHRLSGCQ